jgi:leucyl-tRNA---protein transferase
MRNLTISYDERCRQEFAALYRRLQPYFVSIDTACPYGLPHLATFHQASFAPLGERAMELFLAAGYRRNGNCLYTMHCAGCRACLPIRLQPAEFRPNRNQRRTLKNNQDLELQLLPLQAGQEQLELCEKFLQSRYPQENNRAVGYYRDFFMNNITSSAQLEYRLAGRLLGVALIDIGYNWLNAVYFYFDPEIRRRSLGTYNILQLVELCRQWDIANLYLGYFIAGVPAMSYKRAFRPHQIFLGDRWFWREEEG